MIVNPPILRRLIGQLRRNSPIPRSQWGDFPTKQSVDRARFASDMALAPATTQYVMFFTPRSGSSWICDIATRTGRLGVLGESFNPNFLTNMTRAMNATSLDEYCDIAVRRRARNDVFGFQITQHQLNAVFASEDAFLKRFPSKNSFWLIREDIVLQAISLYRMKVTNLAHSPNATPDKIRETEDLFTYNGPEIRSWLEHILAAEQATEAMITRAGLKPLRMSYERNTNLKPSHLLNVMGRHLGLPTMRLKSVHSAHTKIATGRNAEFGDRFRNEQRDFLKRVDEMRAPTLEKLVYYGPKR